MSFIYSHLRTSVFRETLVLCSWQASNVFRVLKTTVGRLKLPPLNVMNTHACTLAYLHYAVLHQSSTMQIHTTFGVERCLRSPLWIRIPHVSRKFTNGMAFGKLGRRLFISTHFDPQIVNGMSYALLVLSIFSTARAGDTIVLGVCTCALVAYKRLLGLFQDVPPFFLCEQQQSEVYQVLRKLCFLCNIDSLELWTCAKYFRYEGGPCHTLSCLRRNRS